MECSEDRFLGGRIVVRQPARRVSVPAPTP